jgi:hypothetical protein
MENELGIKKWLPETGYKEFLMVPRFGGFFCAPGML